LVTAEIVVIVENEDAALRVGLCTVEVRGGKAAQAAPTTIRSYSSPVSAAAGVGLPSRSAWASSKEPG